MGWSKEKRLFKELTLTEEFSCKKSWQKQNSACGAESEDGRGFSQALEKHTKIYEWQLFRENIKMYKMIIAFYSQRFSPHPAQHTRYIFTIL